MINLQNLLARMHVLAASVLGFPTWYTYLPKNSDGSPSVQSLADIWLIVAAVLEILLRLSALIAIVFIIVGGVQYISSQGEPDKTARARSTIISAVVGMVIAVVADTLVGFVAGQFNGS